MLFKKKAVRVHRETAEEFDFPNDWHSCPKCRARAKIYLYASFCPECGIKLDWKENN